MTIIPIATLSDRRIRVVRPSLFVCFCLVINFALAEVTELPPIRKQEKNLSKPVDEVHGAASVNSSDKRTRATSFKSNSGSPGEMDDLSSTDRALVAKACRSKQYYGPVAYHDCEREQAAAARNSVPVSFKGVPDSDRALIATACRSTQYYGPAAFHACERDQAEALKNSASPSLDGVSSGDRALIAKACRSKQYYGPAAYRACQRDQISQLKSIQTSIPARTQ